LVHTRRAPPTGKTDCTPSLGLVQRTNSRGAMLSLVRVEMRKKSPSRWAVE
jgi:hypothetical protein